MSLETINSELVRKVYEDVFKHTMTSFIQNQDAGTFEQKIKIGEARWNLLPKQEKIERISNCLQSAQRGLEKKMNQSQQMVDDAGQEFIFGTPEQKKDSSNPLRDNCYPKNRKKKNPCWRKPRKKKCCPPPPKKPCCPKKRKPRCPKKRRTPFPRKKKSCG